jgi:hypothetical protein
LNTAISFSLSRSHKSTLKTSDIDPALKKGMNPKKQHEVMKMAALVHDLALKTDCDVIVDIGSGLVIKIRSYCLKSRVTSHYVIDQSMLSICDMLKIFGGEVKQNHWDST